MNNLDPLLSAQQLADYLGIPLATLYAWRYRREGPPGFRAGRHIRYRKNDIDQWINDRLDNSGRHPSSRHKPKVKSDGDGRYPPVGYEMPMRQ